MEARREGHDRVPVLPGVRSVFRRQGTRQGRVPDGPHDGSQSKVARETVPPAIQVDVALRAIDPRPREETEEGEDQQSQRDGGNHEQGTEDCVPSYPGLLSPIIAAPALCGLSPILGPRPRRSRGNRPLSNGTLLMASMRIFCYQLKLRTYHILSNRSMPPNTRIRFDTFYAEVSRDERNQDQVSVPNALLPRGRIAPALGRSPLRVGRSRRDARAPTDSRPGFRPPRPGTFTDGIPTPRGNEINPASRFRS